MIKEKENETTVFYLKNGCWSVDISSETPDEFTLKKNTKVIFRGRLNLIKNNQPIQLDSVSWYFRAKENKLEQWCNILADTSLSVSITYRFENKTLCIEYLARNSTPTRLDLSHSVELLDSTYQSEVSSEEISTMLTGLEHEENTRSHLSSVKQGQSEFREAFYCTQWIMLEKRETVT